MIDFSNVKKLTIPEGNVIQIIKKEDEVLWVNPDGPICNYVAVISRGAVSGQATIGETIRFLVRFDREINLTKKTFKLYINGDAKTFSRSGSTNIWEYIIEYKIPTANNFENGKAIPFSIKGYYDLNGYTGYPLTVGNHHTYKEVIYTE